jgi:predicted nucleic acid-binding protein
MQSAYISHLSTPMKTITSREVQKNFGTVSDLLKAGESIRVTHYGRPAFVMLSETAETDEILRRFAGKRLMHILADAKAALIVTGDKRDLLSMHPYLGGMAIVGLRAFIDGYAEFVS